MRAAGGRGGGGGTGARGWVGSHQISRALVASLSWPRCLVAGQGSGGQVHAFVARVGAVVGAAAGRPARHGVRAGVCACKGGRAYTPLTLPLPAGRAAGRGAAALGPLPPQQLEVVGRGPVNLGGEGGGGRRERCGCRRGGGGARVHAAVLPAWHGAPGTPSRTFQRRPSMEKPSMRSQALSASRELRGGKRGVWGGGRGGVSARAAAVLPA